MSVEQTKYGTWRARWRDASGRQRAKTFDRYQDAVDHEKASVTDLKRGVLVPDAGKLTVAQWADRWLSSARDLGAGGRETYRRDLDRYIIPVLGDLPLERLTADAIDQFLTDELEDAQLAPSTVHRHYRTIHRLAAVAVDRNRLAKNPCAKVRPPKIKPKEMRFLTVKQVDALAEAIGARYRAWVLTACYDGLRWSEGVGLQRKRIDGARIVVADQLIRREDGEWHREEPKTKAGTRTVTSPQFVADALAEHLDTYVAGGPDALVFANREGSPLNGPSFTGNVFKPALERAGIDRNTRIHDLRHTAVALAVAAGAHPKAIQVRMGHASITVTLDRYGHLFPEQDEIIAAGLDTLARPPADSAAAA